MLPGTKVSFMRVSTSVLPKEARKNLLSKGRTFTETISLSSSPKTLEGWKLLQRLREIMYIHV